MNSELLVSTTFQGAVISLVSFIILIFKIDISSEEITQIVSGTLALIGTVMVIIGRIKAKAPIDTIGGISIRN